MTWEELKQKAKEMGYKTGERFIVGEIKNKNNNVYSFSFFEDGDVMIGSVCLDAVSYEKIQKLMEVLNAKG